MQRGESRRTKWCDRQYVDRQGWDGQSSAARSLTIWGSYSSTCLAAHLRWLCTLGKRESGVSGIWPAPLQHLGSQSVGSKLGDCWAVLAAGLGAVATVAKDWGVTHVEETSSDVCLEHSSDAEGPVDHHELPGNDLMSSESRLRGRRCCCRLAGRSTDDLHQMYHL